MIEYADPNEAPGRGGWWRNADGDAVVTHPDGGKRKVVHGGGSSFWSISKPYTGPAIYGEQGQQVHDITDCADRARPLDEELIAKGEALGMSREYQEYIYAGYVTFRKEHGFGEPLYIEKHYVNDPWKVASNIDRVDVVDGLIEFGDTKTATDFTKPDYVVQVATMVDSLPYDVETGTRGEWPHPVNRKRANIFWIPVRRGMRRDETGTWVTNDDRSIWPAWELHHVDLVAAVRLAQRVVDLRETDATSYYQIAAPTPPPVVEQPATDDASHGPAASSVATPTLEELRAEAAEIGRHDPEFTPRLLAYFERNDVDKSDPMQVDEAIRAVVNFRDVATDTQPRPQVSPVIHPIPKAIDEGPEVDTDTVAAAGKRYAGLDDAARSWVSLCAAKVRLSPEHGGVASTRRLELLTGLCKLGKSDGFDTDDIVRAIAAVVGLGDAAWQTRRIADVVAALTLEEAVAFAKVADVVTTGDVAIRWELDGRCVLSASVLGEVA